MNLIRKKLEMKYFIFKYLWIIVLLPKPIQSIVLFYISFVLFLSKKKRNIEYVELFFLFHIFVYLFSLIINFLSDGAEVGRLFATLNTFFSWVIALLLYSYYKEESLDINKIQFFCFINLLIFIFIGLLGKLAMDYQIDSFNIMGRELYRLDWIDEAVSYRLVNYFEYTNLISFFYFLMTPLSFYYIRGKSFLFKSLFVLLCFYIVFLSHSRVGVIFAFLILSCQFLSFLIKDKKKILIFCFFILLLLFVLSFLFYEYISLWIDYKLNSRKGSTDARYNIYFSSLQLMWLKSPFIGIGIKHILENYPLGSHSTYIGFLYKTGIIGSFFAILGVIFMLFKYFKAFILTKIEFHTFICFISFLCFLVIEDLDGSVWGITVFFSLQGIINQMIKVNK
ncbi:O-antigen ligase family protein [Rodentibacter caecimuris]|uniref:O-antigen ligase family protein n=1 Tax=Rodentibacter caecimuris TaxID=1796644 RepID=UPI0013D9F6B9|nr:O-antigen ligase family protein [Rodentibacter heylii]